MIRFIRNLTIVEWLVIAAVTIILGTFAVDEVRGHFAKQRGAADAQGDVAAGEFNFRIGGKARVWYSETATVFRDRFDADLVRSHGCCPTVAQWNYDSAYNDVMSATLARRIDGFAFHDAYNEADEVGRKQMEARLAGP